MIMTNIDEELKIAIQSDDIHKLKFYFMNR